MKPGSTTARWKILAIQIVAVAAAFSAGWYFTKNAGAPDSSPTIIITAHGAHAKKSAPPTAEELASAKARLGEIFHAKNQNKRFQAMLDYVSTLDVDTVKALVDDMGSRPMRPEESGAMQALLDRWTTLDPQAALAWVQNVPNPRVKSYALDQIFDTLSARDPAGALAALSQMKGGLNDYALFETMDNYAKKDPAAALAALRNLPVGRQDGQLYGSIFKNWANQDPSGASTAALKLPASSARSEALQNIATSWATQDPTAAMSFAKTLSGPAQDTAVAAVIKTSARQDPAAAAALASSLPNGPARDALMKDVTATWTQQDPVGLLEYADKNFTGGLHDKTITTAINNLGTTDPAAAAAYLDQHPNPGITNEVASSLAFYWSLKDANAAMAWAKTLPTDNATLRNSVLSSALGMMTLTDPAATAARIQENLADDPAFASLAAQAASSWASSNPQAALAWVQSLPPGDAQNTVLSKVATQMARVDPQGAMNATLQLPATLRGTTQVDIISVMAVAQPAQAAAALQNLPYGGNLNNATTAVAKTWLTQDPNAATQWINTLPTGLAKDNAVGQVVDIVGKTDPAGALNWALSMNNQAGRNNHVVSLARQWATSNPTAAAAAVQGVMNNLTGLTPAQQTDLQKIVTDAAPKNP